MDHGIDLLRLADDLLASLQPPLFAVVALVFRLLSIAHVLGKALIRIPVHPLSHLVLVFLAHGVLLR